MATPHPSTTTIRNRRVSDDHTQCCTDNRGQAMQFIAAPAAAECKNSAQPSQSSLSITPPHPAPSPLTLHTVLYRHQEPNLDCMNPA